MPDPSTPNASAPVRTCVGCRRRAPQPDLRRCVLGADGVAQVSRTGHGRGAWVCSADCVATALRRNGFARAWRCAVPTAATADLAEEITRAFAGPSNDMRDLVPAGAPSPMKG